MLRIVVGVGLLLALGALMEAGPGLGDDMPSVRVTFAVPDGLVVASVAAFALAGLVLLVAARGHRRPEDEGEEAPGKPPLPWWGHAIAQVVLMLPLIITVTILWLDGGRIAGALLAWGRGWFQRPDALPPGSAERPVISLPWLGWSFGLIALMIALATLAVALLLLFSERLIAWWLARRSTAETVEFAEAVDDSLDDLADEPDERIAIIKCYRRFEHAAARAQVRRAPWQTADEFMRDALQRLALPDLAVERLTRLFEIARFSHHPVRSVERDRARACLEEIRTALARRDDPLAVA